MTNEEMKMTLAQNGIAQAEIEKISGKFDAEKITEIVEGASNPKEAFEALHTFYPELEVEKLQKQCDFVMEQVEAAMKEQKKNEPEELTEDELENVAGGGFFSSIGNWFKDNWKKVAIGAAVAVGVALVCTGVGALAGFAVAADVALFHTGVAVGSYMATGAAYGAIGGAAWGTVVSAIAGATGKYD
ncbi:ComC/BlpC family leader-containing pheromone/bacteriocin [Treponema sp.]|uniref:ComC/BlpC family leader-containing pheromone/bacteriocin n=1 Tax=Treponema sp. TaxID=166 RepID=UPI003890F030